MSYIPDQPRSYAQYYLNGATNTIISAQNAFVKISGATVSSALLDFINTNNRSQYIGSIEKSFLVQCNVSCSTTQNKEIAAIRIAKNNILLPGENQIGLPEKDIPGSGSIQNIIPLQFSDYIEIFIGNLTSNRNIRVYNLNVVVEEV